jgi:hypothetical protein
MNFGTPFDQEFLYRSADLGNDRSLLPGKENRLGSDGLFNRRLFHRRHLDGNGWLGLALVAGAANVTQESRSRGSYR